MHSSEIRNTLLARREELLNAISARDDIIDEVTSDEEEDRTQERAEDEVLSALSGAARQELARIDDALVRMDRGDYGICVRCGDEIAEERLAAVPTTTLCMACAQAG